MKNTALYTTKIIFWAIVLYIYFSNNAEVKAWDSAEKQTNNLCNFFVWL